MATHRITRKRPQSTPPDPLDPTNRMETQPTPPDLDLSSVLDLCAELNLMIALVDSDLVIRQATQSLQDYLNQPLVGRSLVEAIPILGGMEAELSRIAANQADLWRVPGLQLTETRLRHCDTLFMPRRDAPGLLVAARQMDEEAAVEQTLRQQRNELTLLQEALEKQASALRTANDRLASLDRERQGLVKLVVNDIRTSLTVVSGYTEWVWSEIQAIARPEHRAAVDAIIQGVAKMNSRVGEVYAMEKIEQALAEMTWESVDVKALVERGTIMQRSIATLRGVTLKNEFVEPLPPVPGNETLLQEAVNNLIEDALAQAPGGASIATRVSTWDRWVIVRLEFTEKRRATPAAAPAAPTKRTGDGAAWSGLSLARARLIAEGHGGHLSIEEERPGRRCVSLWLLKRETPEQKTLSAPGRHGATESGRDEQAAPASDMLVAGEGNIRINTSTQHVWVQAESVSLSASEYRLLVYLAEHTDQVVTHNQLLDTIWSFDQDVSLDNLRVLVWRLRQKLEPAGQKTQYLRTVRGFGYVLVS